MEKIKYAKIIKNYKIELKNFIKVKQKLIKYFIDVVNDFYTKDHNHIFTFDITKKGFYLYIRKIIDRDNETPIIDLDKIVVLYNDIPDNEEHFIYLSRVFNNHQIRVVEFKRHDYNNINKSSDELLYLGHKYVENELKSLSLYHPYLGQNYEVKNEYLSVYDYLKNVNFDENFINELIGLKQEIDEMSNKKRVLYLFLDSAKSLMTRKSDYLHSKSILFKNFFPKHIIDIWRVNCEEKYLYHYKKSYLYISIYSKDETYIEYILAIKFLGNTFDTLLRTDDIRLVKFNKSIGKNIDVDKLDNIIIYNRFDKIYHHIDSYKRFYKSVHFINTLTSFMTDDSGKVIDKILKGCNKND